PARVRPNSAGEAKAGIPQPVHPRVPGSLNLRPCHFSGTEKVAERRQGITTEIQQRASTEGSVIAESRALERRDCETRKGMHRPAESLRLHRRLNGEEAGVVTK